MILEQRGAISFFTALVSVLMLQNDKMTNLGPCVVFLDLCADKKYFYQSVTTPELLKEK